MSNEVDLRKQRKVSAEVTIDTAGLATEATLQAVLDAVDGLELSVGNIEIDADQINLNTDDLESLVTDTNTKLDTLNANDFATEFQQTLQTSLLGDINQSTDEIETKLDNIILVDNSILGELQNNISKEATLIQVRDYLDTVETKLASLITNTTGLNLEVTQIQIRDYLDTVETKLASIITNTTGLNLETTQLLIKAKTDNLDVLLSTRLSKTDFEARINTLGQKTMANSTPVVIASDQSTLNISSTEPTVGSTTVTSVAVSTTVATAAASNVNRKQLLIHNDSGGNIYVKLGSGATTSLFTVRIGTNDYYELPKPIYTGIVTVIRSAGSGNIMVTEL